MQIISDTAAARLKRWRRTCGHHTAPKSAKDVILSVLAKDLDRF
jgi:hypothetical protein